jgi:hypothetical protein
MGERPVPELINPANILINASNVMTKVGQAGSCYETDIAGTYATRISNLPCLPNFDKGYENLAAVPPANACSLGGSTRRVHTATLTAAL